MKRCSQILKIMNTKKLEELSQREQLQLEEHLQSCFSCREHQRYMRLTSNVVERWEVPAVSSKLANIVIDKTRGLPQSITWKEYWLQSKWLPITATAAAVMTLFLVLGSLSLPIQQASVKPIPKSFTYLHDQLLEKDKISIAAQALGLEDQ